MSNFTFKAQVVELEIDRPAKGDNIMFKCNRFLRNFTYKVTNTQNLHITLDTESIYIDNVTKTELYSKIFNSRTGEISPSKITRKIQNTDPLSLLNLDFLEIINNKTQISFDTYGKRPNEKALWRQGIHQAPPRHDYYFDRNTNDALAVMKGWGLHEK